MKKRLIALIVCFVLLFSVSTGCSCDELDTLSFNANFKNETSARKETLHYNITFKKPTTTYDSVTMDFTDGSYSTTLEVYKTAPAELNELDSDIIGRDRTNCEFYKLTTKFTITSSYVIDGKESTNDDEIKTTCYMCDTSYSLAPIYSMTESDYSILNYAGADSTVSRIKTSCEVLYNFDSYKMTSKVINADGSEAESQEKTYDYSFKTIIDNNELLFAIRNSTISSSITIPVISRNYGDAVEVSVENKTAKSKTFDISFNNKGSISTINEQLSYNEYIFYINNTSASGSNQTVCVQNAKGENTPLNYYILSYEEPLIAYTSFTSMGSLIYTLDSIVIE